MITEISNADQVPKKKKRMFDTKMNWLTKSDLEFFRRENYHEFENGGTGNFEGSQVDDIYNPKTTYDNLSQSSQMQTSDAFNREVTFN